MTFSDEESTAEEKNVGSGDAGDIDMSSDLVSVTSAAASLQLTRVEKLHPLLAIFYFMPLCIGMF